MKLNISKKIIIGAASTASALVIGTIAIAADGGFNKVLPFIFDPAKTYLVQGAWMNGIGCPTNAKVQLYNSNPPYNLLPPSTYTDNACKTGDSSDKTNQGLLLVKTGPTLNNASAGATLQNVKGLKLTELGYDLRKQGSTAALQGSHCGAGAPRFNVVTSDGTTHFVGCNSPTPTVTDIGNGWIRLRWNAALLLASFPPILATDTVKSISIVFDEGQDTSGGPDQFGAAILDNIDVNGVLVGHGTVGEQQNSDNKDGENND